MMKKKLLLNNKEITIEKLDICPDSVSFNLGGKDYLFKLESKGVLSDEKGQRHFFQKAKNEIWAMGQRFEIESLDRPRKKGAGTQKGNLLAPMPGKILKLLVTEGQSITQGDSLLIMEAMKMEHTIKAPFDGIVKSLPFAVGDQIQAKVALIELTPLHSEEE
jgi:acetyl/propionyl-CoA carboxylase alpha subunit